MLTRGLANRPDSPALNLAWGERLHARGDLDGAIRHLRKSIELRPNEAPAYISLAAVRFQKNELAEAEDLLRESLEYEPGNPVVLTAMARLSIRLLDRTEADEWMERVREQPRILAEHVEMLEEQYEEAFGIRP
jgi:Flp pilus assembly protein TadD